MDVATQRETRPSNTITETPASLVSQYSSFESEGNGIENFDQGFEEMDLPYGHEVEPMMECMGAPTREAHVSISRLSPAQEEVMLAAVEESFDRARLLEHTGSINLQSLKDACNLMQQLWEGGSLIFPEAIKALLKLGRTGNFSAILGEAGFLDLFLGILSTGDVLDEIVIPSLQFVGDICEKIETNKARVVAREAILPLLYKLWNPSLVPAAIPTLYQICLGYEPAQQQAADLATARILIDLLKRPEGEGVPKGGGAYVVLVTVCLLLNMMSARVAETELYSDMTSKELFELATKNEGDQKLFMHLMHAAITWLKMGRVRTYFTSDDNAELLLHVLEASCTRPNRVLLSTPEDGKLLQNIRFAIVEALAAISAVSIFSVNHKPDGNFVAILRAWLQKAQPQLQACACIVLGNIASVETNAKMMIEQFRLHDVSLFLIENCGSVQVRAAAAVLLKALIVPSECRKAVEEKLIIRAASYLWSMTDSPQLQYLGVALTLQALEGSYSVLEQLLSPLSPDPDSPAHLKTNLTRVLRLWQDYYGHRQHEKLVFAIAWIVANVCGTLWSPSPPGPLLEVEKLKNRVLMQHQEISNSLRSLLLLENQSAARSKFWFVMALMAEDPEAISIVSSTIDTAEASKALFGLLTRTRPIEGSQFQKDYCQYDDRNMLIMISRLVKNTASFNRGTQDETLLKLVEGVDLESMSKENPFERVRK